MTCRTQRYSNSISVHQNVLIHYNNCLFYFRLHLGKHNSQGPISRLIGVNVAGVTFSNFFFFLSNICGPTSNGDWFHNGWITFSPDQQRFGADYA